MSSAATQVQTRNRAAVGWVQVRGSSHVQLICAHSTVENILRGKGVKNCVKSWFSDGHLTPPVKPNIRSRSEGVRTSLSTTSLLNPGA